MKRALLVLRWMPLALSGWLSTPMVHPMFAWSRLGVDQQQKSSAVDLDVLLAKTADYCRRLESAILDFVCREEISEKINPVLDAPPPPSIRTWTGADNWSGVDSRGAIAISAAPSKIKNSYVYDYQCIRKDGRFEEIRTLLEENKKTKNEPDAKLKTSIVFYENVLLGPVGIFKKEYQTEYDYKIVGQDKFEKKPVIVVDAKPKPDAPGANTLYGKAWIDPVTGNIVKIEYSENRIGRYEVFKARGEKYNRTPRINERAEFSEEKNGLRFPSKLFIEETYINSRGRAFVRSETTVVYTDFKFFTVDVEIK
jgi:hypothetical protein